MIPSRIYPAEKNVLEGACTAENVTRLASMMPLSGTRRRVFLNLILPSALYAAPV